MASHETVDVGDPGLAVDVKQRARPLHGLPVKRVSYLAENDCDDREGNRGSSVLAGRTERLALGVRRGEHFVLPRLLR